MSITFYNQWLQWVNQGDFNWSEFDLVTIAFERDKVALDWSVDIALLGIGFHFHYASRASAELWAEVAGDE